MEQYRNDEALLETESYLEKMQKIFADREATYQKRKAEYDERNQELEQIRKELWQRSQTLEQKEEKLTVREAALAEKEAVLERRETDFAEEKTKYEAQLQKQILQHQLELEALRNEKMLAEDARRAYEYQTGQMECGFGKDTVEKWEAENRLLKEERAQLQNTICQLQMDIRKVKKEKEETEKICGQLQKERLQLLEKLMGTAGYNPDFANASVPEESKGKDPEKDGESFSASSREQEESRTLPDMEYRTVSGKGETERITRLGKEERKPETPALERLQTEEPAEEISREELTANVLKGYLEKHDPAVQPEIRHSERGEQLHMETKNLTYVFLFQDGIIQFEDYLQSGREPCPRGKTGEDEREIPGIQFNMTEKKDAYLQAAT